ncbi:MAG: hypothetical protein IJD81_03960 [Oscillospiraceae bacterium]|nr:hypothetical protein [Oscillospiraceae bacterium]
MKHLVKISAICLLILAMLMSLCACGASDTADTNTDVDVGDLKRNLIGLTPDDFKLLVQGNLDEIYLGVFDDKYLALVDGSEASAQEIYDEGMAYEAEYFCYYFDVEYPTDAFLQELIDVYKEIYGHSKYKVGDASKLDETTYVVKLTVSPIDIMELVLDAVENGAADSFYDKYANVNVEAMTEAEYQAYDEEWAYMILDILRDQLPNIGYLEEETLAVQIVLENDVWMIGDSDLSTIDSLIIAYP